MGRWSSFRVTDYGYCQFSGCGFKATVQGQVGRRQVKFCDRHGELVEAYANGKVPPKPKPTKRTGGGKK